MSESDDVKRKLREEVERLKQIPKSDWKPQPRKHDSFIGLDDEGKPFPVSKEPPSTGDSAPNSERPDGVSKEDEARGREAIEEYKRALREHANDPPLIIPPERWDRFSGPPGDDEIREMEARAKKA